MRIRSRTWFVLSLLLFAAAYWVWVYAERLSASRRAQAAQAVPSTVSQPLNPGPNLSKTVATTKPADAKSYHLSNTRATEKQLLRSSHAILLRNALIDTDRPLKLGIPDHLRAKGAPGSYIVQSRAALDQRFYDRLKKDGVAYVSYIPNNAALVQATPDQARQMASDAEFQAVIPFEPYYKLATSLLPSAVAQDQPLSEALNVTAMPGQRDATLAALNALGAQLMGEETGPFGTTLSVMVPPGKLVAVAQLPLAQEIETYAPRRMLNDLSRVIMNISSNTLYSNANYLNLNGQGVVVNMNDTGVDSTHPDFGGTGGTNGTRLLGATTALTDQTSGHGTHVAGTIMGNGVQSMTINSATNPIPGSVPGAGFQGKATNALLFVQALGIVSGTTIDDAYQIGGSLISDAYLETNASVNLGPTNLISNNSWGYAPPPIGESNPPPPYDMHAASFDQATRDAQPNKPGEQPLLFVFAAGGNGDGNVYGEGGQAGTILSPATAKNVITVGALDEARFITNGVTFDGVDTNDIFFTWTDNDQYVAWFSSCGNIGPGIEGTYGRFKPDVVAPGMFTISCRASNYVDPSNATYLTIYPYLNQLVLPGQTNDYPLAIPSDTELLAIVITPNANSPTPFPPMTVLGDPKSPPTTVQGTNYVVLSNQVESIPGEWYFGVEAPGQVHPVAYDLTFYLVETNDLGVSLTNTNGYYHVISNLNSILKPSYVYQSGTSQAAGAVSGMLALMEQFMRTNTVLNVPNPSPALLKAMLINGSRSAEEQYDFNTQPLGPNEQGWGLPNLTNSLPVSLTGGGGQSMWVLDQSTNDALATGQSQSFSINAADMGATNYPVRISLVWTDPPGDPAAGVALVNNLALVVTDGTSTNVWVGNDFFAGDIFTELNTGDLPDVVNNVQNVYIDNGNTPFKYPLTVSVLGMRVNVNAATTVTNLIAQDYALVISSDDTNAGFTPPTIIAPSYAPPTNLVALTNTNMFTNGIGAPLLAAPLLAFAQGYDELVTYIVSGSNYLHERVGANEPNLYSNGVLYASGIPPISIPPLTLGTNGNILQWHFFVFTNNQYILSGSNNYMGSNVIATNFMVTTFMPPDLATQIQPRTNGADIDLYVSTNLSFLNLAPAAFAAMPTNFMSLGRGGNETVIDTNSQNGEVYYIGVKSEDQQAADFGIYAVAQQQPFSLVNADGSVTASAGPLVINDSLEGPPAILHLYVGPSPINPQMILRKVTAELAIIAGNPSDYYGTLQGPSGVMDVLNHYSGFNPGFTNFYNDLDDNTIPGSIHSDGPGSLTSFINTSGLGDWMLTESDNALLQVGEIYNITLTAFPQPPQSGFLETLCGQQWFFDYAIVPDDATNMTISITYVSGTDQLGLFISPSNNVSATDDGVMINPPGGYLTYSITNKPPLAGGVWYYGIYNYAQSSNDCDTFEVQVSFGLSQVPNLTQTFTNNTFIPLVTDGTTNASQICISNGQSLIDLSVGVRLNDTNLDDLTLQLTSPQGTSIVLFENRGGLLANSLGLTLTNAASSNSVSSNYVYTVFTEDSNLATVPIKFAPPPYAAPVVVTVTNIYAGTFETFTNLEDFYTNGGTVTSNAAGTYTNGQNVAGWFLETNLLVTNMVFTNVVTGPSTNMVTNVETIVVTNQYFNEVSVVTDPSLTAAGITPIVTNYLALASGRLSRTFTTIPGAAYELIYYARSPGLTDWWPADDNTVDLVGTNNGTIPYNDVTFGEGEVDRAFMFSGTGTPTNNAVGNEVDFGTNAGNFGTNNFSVDFWIKQPVSSDGTYGVMQKRLNCSDTNSQWGILSGTVPAITGSTVGQLDLEVSSTGPVNTSYFHCNKVINDGGFHHAAFTRSGTNLSIYIDGILDTNYSSNGIANISNVVPFRVGQKVCVGIDGPVPFLGEIDELDLWQRALSPAEIHAIYQAGSVGKYDTNSSYPNFQVVFDGVSTNDVKLPNFAETNWQLYTNSFIANSNQTTIELWGNTLGVLLDGFELIQLPYTNYNNYYLPEEPLTPLIGQNPQGCWTLSVWDTRTDTPLATDGTLLSWTLQMTTSSTNVDLMVLSDDVPYCTSNLPPNGGFLYFAVDVPPTANFATNMLYNANGAMNVFFNQNALPTGTLPGDVTLITLPAAGASNRTISTQGAPPPLLPGQRYFLGVQNVSASSFCLEVDFDVGTNGIINPLTNGMTLDPSVTTNQPVFYSFVVPTNAVLVTFQLFPTNGEADLYAREGMPVPTPYYFDYASRNEATNDQFIVVTTNSLPVPLQVVNTNNIEPLSPTTWYLSVYNPGTNTVGYSILATYVTNGPNGSKGAIDIVSLNNYTNYTYTNGVAQKGFPTNLLYSFTIPGTSLGEVEFVVTNISTNGNLQLLVGDDEFPTPQASFAGSYNLGASNQMVVIVTNSALPTVSATWYLAVVNTSSNVVKYSITAIVTNGPLMQPLTWDGGAGYTWNFTEADWRRVSGGADTTYNDTDPVTFDDSLTSGRNSITIPGTVLPGGVTFNNSPTNTYKFTGTGGIGGTNGLTLENNGTVILDNSSNSFTGLINIIHGLLEIGENDTNGTIVAGVTNSSTLAFNRIDNLTYGGSISGNGTLLKINSNILTLSADNTNLFGAVDIIQGTLRLGATNALGSGSNALVHVFNGATLDLNTVGGTNYVTVSGVGVSSNGAIVNNGTSVSIPGLASITMTGDTTIGGLQSWYLLNPVGGGTNLSTGGHAYNLTKVGTNLIGLISVGVDPALANIDVKAGTLAYAGTTDSLGNPTNILTLESNATLELADATNALNKVIEFDDGSTNFNATGSNIITGPVVLNTNAVGGPGTVTFNIGGTSLLLTNAVIGPGNLIVTGGQPLYLSGTNTYTGSTLVTTGTVLLINTGSIGGSSNVAIASNATIDATARVDMTYTAPSGQTLQGFGDINGLLRVAPGGTIAPGATNATGAFTVSSNISLAGTAFFKYNDPNGTNDILISSNGSIAYGGLLSLSNVTTNLLTNGEIFQIFSAVSNVYFGGFTNVYPAQPAYGLYWYTNLLTVNGTIEITNAPVSLPLTWDGVVSSNWNYSDANWRPPFGPDTTYADTDPVTFDDSVSAGRNTINIIPFVQPGGMTFSNSASNTYTFVGSGGIAGITGISIESNGTVILDNSGSNTFTGEVAITNGTLQIGNNDTNGGIFAGVFLASTTNTSSSTLVFKRSDNSIYSGAISGNGTIVQNDSNILTLAGDSTNLHGFANILQGTLRLGAPNALGPGTNVSISVSSGAALDLNSVPGTNFVIASGAGVGGGGAIVNNGILAAVPGISYLTMTANTTLGGLQRWDLRNNNTNDAATQPTNFSFLSTGGHPYNLTKVGTNVISIVNSSVDAALANVDIQAGALNYEGSTSSLGNTTNTLTVETGATLELYNATNGLNKVIVFKDGSTNFNGAGTNKIYGPVTLSTNASGGPGTVTFNINGTSQLVSNRISGTGNLIVTGGQPLYISAASTYSGFTLVTNGALYLVSQGSIGFSPSVMISSNSTINVNGSASTTYGYSGQTLQGFGNIVGRLTIPLGGIVAPGSSNATGVLTASSTVRLSGTAFFKVNNIAGGANDVLAAQDGVINYGGTLQITNVSAVPFAAGESFQLFNGNFGYAGAFTNIVPATPGPGLAWNTSNLGATGAISITGVTPSPTTFTFITLSGTNLIFRGTNGIPNGPYVVLTSTNLTQPWTPLSTNNFDASGDFSFTNNYNPSIQQQFFTIEQP